MGGKPTKIAGESSKTPKSELNRTKSFSSLGRSSQRSLFQKSKARLNQINKNLTKYKDKDGPEVLDNIRKQLEGVEKELNGVSQAIKEKNKQKYEEIWKYLQETRQAFEGKTKATVIEENGKDEVEEVPVPTEVPQQVELKLVKVIPQEDQDVELRQQAPINEEVEERRSPKVKFGIQVMPINPRVSQELLKRNTLPINEAPKAEFIHIRQRAQSDGQVLENDLYNFSNPQFPNNVLPEQPLKELQKRQINVAALQEIEEITHDIDVLEERLKYFHGTNQDVEYLELHERFIRGLLKLDNLDTQGDPVVRQERKISIQRIQELMKILEYLVKQPEEPEVDDDSTYDLVEKRQEEVVNSEGKPITATAL